MTDCNSCGAWYATTEKQWRNRQRNIELHPDVRAYVCVSCGSSEWATSRKYIRPPVRRKAELAVLLLVGKWVMACARQVFIAIGRRLPQDLDSSGKDRNTRSRLK